MNTNLKKMREAKGLTQAKVAADNNIARTSYLKYENGTHDPSLEQLCALANYFEVSVDDLLCNNSSFWSTPFLSALKRYSTVMEKVYNRNLYPEIINYYKEHPEYINGRLRGERLKVPEKRELEEILGLGIDVALALGCSICSTPEEYSDLYRNHLDTRVEMSTIILLKKLNEEGNAKVITYINDLISAGTYSKESPPASAASVG